MACPPNSEEYQTMRKALILLHSSHPNSATELRMLLDEAIKKHYGPERMLCNRLTKEQLDAEAHFPGRAATPPPPTTPEQTDEVINLTHSPAKTISESPDTIVDSEEGGAIAGESLLGTVEDDGNLKEFGDLNCCVCGQMMFTATNRLVECSMCGTLYHQECHKPAISDAEASDDQGHNWLCDSCFNKPSTTRAAGIIVVPDEPMPLVTGKTKSSAPSSHSSNSSNSSSPFHKQEQTTIATSVPLTTTSTVVAGAASSTSKHHQKSSTSSKSHKSERTKSTSSSKSSTSKSSRYQENNSSGNKRKLK